MELYNGIISWECTLRKNTHSHGKSIEFDDFPRFTYWKWWCSIAQSTSIAQSFSKTSMMLWFQHIWAIGTHPKDEHILENYGELSPDIYRVSEATKCKSCGQGGSSFNGPSDFTTVTLTRRKDYHPYARSGLRKRKKFDPLASFGSISWRYRDIATSWVLFNYGDSLTLKTWRVSGTSQAHWGFAMPCFQIHTIYTCDTEVLESNGKSLQCFFASPSLKAVFYSQTSDFCSLSQTSESCSHLSTSWRQVPITVLTMTRREIVARPNEQSGTAKLPRSEACRCLTNVACRKGSCTCSVLDQAINHDKSRFDMIWVCLTFP